MRSCLRQVRAHPASLLIIQGNEKLNMILKNCSSTHMGRALARTGSRPAINRLLVVLQVFSRNRPDAARLLCQTGMQCTAAGTSTPSTYLQELEHDPQPGDAQRLVHGPVLVSVNRVANRPSWMDLLLVPRSSPASPSGLRAACTGRPAHVCTHQGAHAHIKDVRPTDVTVNKLDSSSLTLLACCSGPGCRCCLSSDSLMRPSTTLQHWKSCRRAGTAAHTAAWSAQDMRASQ